MIEYSMLEEAYEDGFAAGWQEGCNSACGVSLSDMIILHSSRGHRWPPLTAMAETEKGETDARG